jgi:hypothetical protein
VLLAVTVGALAAGLAAFDGAGACAAMVPPGGSADPECWHLVRVLAERMGALVALATAVVALTAVGLSRLLVAPDRKPTEPPPA